MDEIQKVIDARNSDNPFSQKEMFFQDAKKDIKEDLTIIKEALLKKDGLVDAEK